jgi:ferric-dicitrate binding protein FerR (iron transport regulator)
MIGYNVSTSTKNVHDEITQEIPHKNEVKAKSGAKSRLTLPDGTKVWLNAESRITYNNNFNTKTREVELEGEAFFDVVKNPYSPFIVHTTGIDIKVLGTAFNVKSYPHEQTIEATLVRGSIEVVKTDEPMGPKVILQPHEKLVFTRAMDSLQKISTSKVPQQEMMVTSVTANVPDSVMKETSWVYNKLYFDGDTFSELGAKMERWFNVRITFKNEKVAAYRFKGVFKNETIEQALKALQLTADFKYNVDGNEVEIY